MKRVGGLWDSVTSFQSLRKAAIRAARGKSSDQANAFLCSLESQVLRLKAELDSATYLPCQYRTFTIYSPKLRTISAADFRDRVVHHAMCAVLEPLWERRSIYDSYACREGKGTLAAILRAQQFTRKWRYFLKLDILHYFETVDHCILKSHLRRLIKDRRVLDLADRFIDAGAPRSPPGKGIPIGNLTSQHFANFLLSYLDHFIKEELGIHGYVRYMDDMVFWADTKAELWAVKNSVEGYLDERLSLRLKAPATILAPTSQGIPFLGMRVWPRLLRLGPGQIRRFRRQVRTVVKAYALGHASNLQTQARLCGLNGHVLAADTFHMRTAFLKRLGDAN